MSERTLSGWTFVDALGEGVYGIDLTGACLFVNKAALIALGYEHAEDLIGRNMHDAIHHTRPDGSQFPQDQCPLINAGRTGQAVRLENETLWRRDRTPFLAEYSSYPVIEDGHIIASVITFRENAVLDDARTRLAVQYAVSQVLAGNSRLPAMMIGVLETIGRGFGWEIGRFSSQNGGDEDAGLRVVAEWDMLGQAANSDTSVKRADLPRLGAEAWKSQKSIHVADLTSDASVGQYGGDRVSSGFAFPVGVGQVPLGVIEFYSHHRIGMDDNLRAAVRVVGQLVGQALERHRVVAALRASENRFQVIADTIPQLAWMAGPDGAITWYNQRWYDFTGTTFKQMSGWGWIAVHHPDHLARVERGLRVCLASGEAWEDTFPLRARDGAYRWFLSRALPIRAKPDDVEPEGQILGWFGTNTDITRIRDVERSQIAALDEAEAANLAKSLFLANMSHELRTPLSAIIGYAEMLIEEVEDGEEPDQLVRDVRKIETNARHLLGLINDVLDLSKVESGKMEVYAETFDLAAVVSDVATMVKTLVEKNGNTLVLRLPDDLGRMRSDVTRIRQVLLNLLSNSAKFTTNGEITLSAAREPGRDGTDWIRLAVADTGLGMSVEQMTRLFQRFQQADASTTRRFGGTGLGLSLAKVFCQLLGGDIDVSSEAGRGSIFTVRLPATLPLPLPPESEVARVSGNREVVLVIDDDATQCELMSRFLERTGFVARTAADGATGLTLAKELHPHAILLDVTMPGMDGWSVLSALKAAPETADIPVVMVTILDERSLATSLGAADYLMKPVEWDRLRLVMDRFREAEGDILVVDDDTDTRERMRRILEANGWTVSEAGDGNQALEHVAVAVPRVILLDLAMPGMDGYDFLRLLRDRPGCGTVPVVVLTSMDLSLADRRRLRGANQVLNKGTTSLNELMGKLRSIGTLNR